MACLIVGNVNVLVVGIKDGRGRHFAFECRAVEDSLSSHSVINYRNYHKKSKDYSGLTFVA